MKPAVTILIDTYNHERFIEEAIVSAQEQDFPRADTEILVVHVSDVRVRKLQPHDFGRAVSRPIANPCGIRTTFLDRNPSREIATFAQVGVRL